MRRTATALAAALALYAAGCGGGEEAAPEEPAAAAPASTTAAPATTATPVSDDCTDRSYWTSRGYSRAVAEIATAHAGYFLQWTDIDPCQYTDPAALEAAKDKHRAPYGDAPDTAAAAEAATPPPEPPPSTGAVVGAPPPSTAPDAEDTGPAEVFAEEGELGVVAVTIPPDQPVEPPEPPPEPEQPEIVVVPAPTTGPPGGDVLPEPDNPHPEPVGEVVRLEQIVPLSEVADIENPDALDTGGEPASTTCVYAHGFALPDLAEGARWTYQTDNAPGRAAEGIEAWHVETVITTPAEHPGHINALTYWWGLVSRETYDVYPNGDHVLQWHDPKQAVAFYPGNDRLLYRSSGVVGCGG